MSNNRRAFLKKTALASAGIAGLSLGQSCAEIADRAPDVTGDIKRTNPLGVSTYSFWQFNGPKEDFPIEQCIDDAARMGFDGIELLLVQMASEENAYLQGLKRRAFHAGLDLMGFSTHQGFISPEKEYRKENVDKTIQQIELAYKLGIPTMRLNTGRWRTIESFDE